MKVRIESDFLKDTYNIFIYEKHGDDLFIAQPVELKLKRIKDRLPGNTIPNLKPTIQMDGLFAIEFFNAFFKEFERIGLQSSIVDDLKSVLKAKESHLEDMRKIAFSFVKPAGTILKEEKNGYK